ncbi:aspartyl protease family protein [Sphingomonas sp. RB56-2]|uniref:Aspartyl protease family protein n=1 Tax=Sphingomonas brevis TaxID=2908206 RepID=A0ABT0SCC8_9SPHN|nr:aspartyl protease family protein [Sphingomonas brevis]MCL6742052.1 aspartyl protease family protein [Sphingomonas brevis]
MRLAVCGLLFAASTGLFLHAASAQIATPAVSAVAGRSPAIPFELYRGNRIVLSGRINGVETEMMLDSGAGVTTLDKAFAAKIGLKGGQKIDAEGTGGRQDAELYQNVTIEAGNLKFSGATVVAIDLTQIAKTIGRPIPVVLGRELFVNSVIGMDFEQGEMTLASPQGFTPPAGAHEVKLTRDDTLHFLPISIGGLPPIDAAFDIGNGGAISLSQEYHSKQPLIASLPYGTSLAGGVGGLHEARRVTLPTVEIGGFTFDNVPADLGGKPNGPYAGKANVGIQMLKQFKLTMDLGHDRIWLERGKRPVEFFKDRSGLFTLLEGDHFNVLHVSPGSPADRAGFKKGDRLTAINGVAVGPAFYNGQLSGWARGVPGTRVEIRKSDGATVTLTLANYY